MQVETLVVTRNSLSYDLSTINEFLAVQGLPAATAIHAVDPQSSPLPSTANSNPPPNSAAPGAYNAPVGGSVQPVVAIVIAFVLFVALLSVIAFIAWRARARNLSTADRLAQMRELQGHTSVTSLTINSAGPSTTLAAQIVPKGSESAAQSPALVAEIVPYAKVVYCHFDNHEF